MTALPNHTDFNTVSVATVGNISMRPKITEHYWGYEVASHEQVINVAVLLRAVSAVFAVASFVAVFGFWVMPAVLFAGSTIAMKFLMSCVLLAFAVILTRIAIKGTRVRVQVDTAKGELREVVDGAFGSVHTLASYGIDTVRAVDVVASSKDPSFGQVQLTIEGVGVIPAGDGAFLILQTLRDRLATDCGLGVQNAVEPTVWAGPLTA